MIVVVADVADEDRTFGGLVEAAAVAQGRRAARVEGGRRDTIASA